MGYVEKNKDDPTGNTQIVDDTVFTWEADGELPITEDDRGDAPSEGMTLPAPKMHRAAKPEKTGER